MEQIVSVHDLFLRACVPSAGHTPGETTAMLTRKQFELLRFIHERLKEAGVPPSFDEMKDALDLRSKSGIHRLITALEERGFIRRLPNRARAIEVIKLPESVAHGIGSGRARGFTPSVIEGNLGRVRAGVGGRQRPPGRGPGDGPHRRRHADRGDPDQAATSSTCRPTCSAAGEHFALEVRGDSMIEAGILDGDIALITQDRGRRHRRHRGGADRRGGSDAEALPPPRRLDRARAGQHRLRGAHPAAQPRAHPGQAGRAVPAVLIDSGFQILRCAASHRARAAGRDVADGRARRARPRPVVARRACAAVSRSLLHVAATQSRRCVCQTLAVDHRRRAIAGAARALVTSAARGAILVEGFDRRGPATTSRAVGSRADAAGGVAARLLPASCPSAGAHRRRRRAIP